MYRLLAVLVGWTLVSTGFCYGADDDFVDCLQVIPDRERLTCYDRFAREALSRGTAEADDRSAPVVAEPRVVKAEPALAAALIPEPKLESPASRKAQHKVRPSLSPTGSATIVKIDKLPNRRYQLTLSDGAIWREIEGSSFRRYKVGAEVTIKRGAFGSHTLLTQGVRAKVTPIDP